MAIAYTIKRSIGTRAMRLRVYPDARVVVSAPAFFGAKMIERFVAKHTTWISKHIEKVHSRNVIRISRRDIAGLKKRALVLANARCAHFSSMYGFTHSKISIRAQKSRWGSCSRAGNLSFNYKIAVLPPHLADYIVVHELCHLSEMNHSKKFWDLVAYVVPQHRALRKELRNIVTVFY